jgi:hypothetical protein
MDGNSTKIYGETMAIIYIYVLTCFDPSPSHLGEDFQTNTRDGRRPWPSGFPCSAPHPDSVHCGHFHVLNRFRTCNVWSNVQRAPITSTYGEFVLMGNPQVPWSIIVFLKKTGNLMPAKTMVYPVFRQLSDPENSINLVPGRRRNSSGRPGFRSSHPPCSVHSRRNQAMLSWEMVRDGKIT